MKRFLFAVAVVALFGAVSYAEDKPAVASAPAAGTVVSPTYTYEQPTQRRGLLARLRSRSTTSSYSTTPLMTAPAPAATPMPQTAPAPMPMPNSASAPKSGTVVQASGNLPPGTYTATDGTTVQVGGTTSAMRSTSARMGLFSRLRNR